MIKVYMAIRSQMSEITSFFRLDLSEGVSVLAISEFVYTFTFLNVNKTTQNRVKMCTAIRSRVGPITTS